MTFPCPMIPGAAMMPALGAISPAPTMPGAPMIPPPTIPGAAINPAGATRPGRPTRPEATRPGAGAGEADATAMMAKRTAYTKKEEKYIYSLIFCYRLSNHRQCVEIF